MENLDDDSLNNLIEYLDDRSYFKFMETYPSLAQRSRRHSLLVYINKCQDVVEETREWLNNVEPSYGLQFNGKKNLDLRKSTIRIHDSMLRTLRGYSRFLFRSNIKQSEETFLADARITDLREILDRVKRKRVSANILTRNLATKIIQRDVNLLNDFPLAMWEDSLTPEEYQRITGGDYRKMEMFLTYMGKRIISSDPLDETYMFGTFSMIPGSLDMSRMAGQGIMKHVSGNVTESFLFRSLIFELDKPFPDVNYLQHLNSLHRLTDENSFRDLVASLMPHFFLGHPEYLKSLSSYFPEVSYPEIYLMVQGYSEGHRNDKKESGLDIDMTGYQKSLSWLLEYLPYELIPPA